MKLILENWKRFINEQSKTGQDMQLHTFHNPNANDFSFYKNKIESFNKENSLNIIVFNLENIKEFSIAFEDYLLNLNKKILIIADNNFKLNNFIIKREEEISNKKVIYINTDIQYGSRFILKRILDIIISIFLLPFLTQLMCNHFVMQKHALGGRGAGV